MAWTSALEAQLRQITAALGLSHDELAMALGTDRKTVQRWLAEETFPQARSRARLDALEALTVRLRETFDSPEAASDWLRAESARFGGLRPLDALLRGRVDAVEAALEALDSGVFV